VPLWLLYGVVAADLRCGERCETGGPWHESGDGWQWLGQLGIAAVGASLLIAAAYLVGRERMRTAGLCVVASAALFAVWIAVVGRHVSIG
jgi:hypothetical protein